jgi:hypothetical protein
MQAVMDSTLMGADASDIGQRAADSFEICLAKRRLIVPGTTACGFSAVITRRGGSVETDS